MRHLNRPQSGVLGEIAQCLMEILWVIRCHLISERIPASVLPAFLPHSSLLHGAAASCARDKKFPRRESQMGESSS